jgi:tripartite-type tricarboxylate transporter receptor subunit TctC
MRRTLLSVIALVTLAMTNQAVAQEFPNKVVRIVMPYPAGGVPDIMARQFAQRLTTTWGQSVIVENKPGAGTIVGTQFVARSAPDGHTILFTTDPTMTVNKFLYKNLPYDPDKDFIPVTQLLEFHQVLMAHPSVPASSLRELIVYAKANPGKLSYASYGVGSQAHIAGELLKNAAAVDITHVPYKGFGDAGPAMLRGEVSFTFGAATTAGPLMAAGRIKGLAIGGDKRSPVLPDVPTFAELGYPEVVAPVWFGVFVPAGTPAHVVDRINRDFVAIINDPEYRKKEVLGRGYEPIGSSPTEFAAYIRKDREMRGRAAKLAGIVPE